MIKALNNNEVSFVLVTLSYWFFMLTDGALRMLVLLHFHTLGYTPLQLAYLFLLYEFFGMITNLTAGWIAKKIGFERLILKNGTMRLHFTTKTDSTYFESEMFGKILEYLKLNFGTCEMREKNSKLSLVITNVNSASKAIDICKDILS